MHLPVFGFACPAGQVKPESTMFKTMPNVSNIADFVYVTDIQLTQYIGTCSVAKPAERDGLHSEPVRALVFFATTRAILVRP